MRITFDSILLAYSVAYAQTMPHDLSFLTAANAIEASNPGLLGLVQADAPRRHTSPVCNAAHTSTLPGFETRYMTMASDFHAHNDYPVTILQEEAIAC